LSTRARLSCEIRPRLRPSIIRALLVKSFDRAQVTVEADPDISRDGVRLAQAFEGEAAT
jgi:hypothetical protein